MSVQLSPILQEKIATVSTSCLPFKSEKNIRVYVAVNTFSQAFMFLVYSKSCLDFILKYEYKLVIPQVSSKWLSTFNITCFFAFISYLLLLLDKQLC